MTTPVLDDGDVSIYESGAIVEYVMARYGDGGLKPAVDAPEFPEYLQWFHYCEGMVMPPINTIMVHTVILPPDRRDETVLGQAQRLLVVGLGTGRQLAAFEVQYDAGDPAQRQRHDDIASGEDQPPASCPAHGVSGASM